MLKLRILNSRTPTELKEIELHPETMLNRECPIGRSPNASLVLDRENETSKVSRMHGKISFQEGNYYFTDTASTHGSWVNTEHAKINHDYRLKVGDVVQIGRDFLLIILEVGSAEETTVVVPPVEEPKTVIDVSNGDVQVPPKEIPIAPPASPDQYMPVALVEPAQITRWTKGELTLRCARVVDETNDVKTFCFVANPPVLFTYKPGQFITLDLEINGEQVLRSYSISSTPSRPHTLEITVKQVPPPPDRGAETPRGLVSNWLHENITAGSEIKVSGPLGKFTCFANPSQKLLMISAGSGITPMMSMSRWIVDTASDCDIIFLHSARSPRDIIFRQELESMSGRYPNFHLAITTTRQDPGQSWLGLTGRINPAILKMVAPDFQERTVYVCGPNTFMEGVNEILESLDFPMHNYYEESFGPPRKVKKPKPADEPKAQPTSSDKTPSRSGLQSWLRRLPAEPPPAIQDNGGRSIDPQPPVPSPSTSSQIAVVFSKSGKEVTSDGEDPILNLAEQEGVKIRSSCRSGNCGTCKKRKLEGEVTMEGYDPEALEESERQEGYILTCISYPKGRVVIDA
jgi:ferredoxin-NADP reductase/ferredoxin